MRARSRIDATDATECGTLSPAAWSAWPAKMPHHGAPWNPYWASNLSSAGPMFGPVLSGSLPIIERA